MHDSARYIPLLAKEGIKYNVGGKGMRGGMLLQGKFVIVKTVQEGGEENGHREKKKKTNKLSNCLHLYLPLKQCF